MPTELNAMSSVKGRIKKILIADNVRFFRGQKEADNKQQLENVLERYISFISTMAAYAHPDIQFIFLVSVDYDIGHRPVADANQRYLNEVYIKLRQKAETFGFDPQRQIIFLEPVLDFEVLFNQSMVQRSPGQISDEGVDCEGFSKWIQDPFFVLKSGTGFTALLDPFYYWQGPNAGIKGYGNGLRNREDKWKSKFVADQIAAQTDMLVKPTLFFFDAGNILVGDKFMLVGSNFLKKNFEEYEAKYESFHELVFDIRKTFGVDYVLCPGLRQVPDSAAEIPEQNPKLYHLDLFLTPGGRDRDDHHIIFLAEVLTYCKKTNEFIRKGDDPLNQYLDGLEPWFEGNDKHQRVPFKFKVIRIPLIKTGEGLSHFYSYNNCLIEVFDGNRLVYLPSYSYNHPDTLIYQRADFLAKACFEKAGFTVIMIDAEFFKMATSGAGSLRCITKVLERQN